jgi:hypothetical protein
MNSPQFVELDFVQVVLVLRQRARSQVDCQSQMQDAHAGLFIAPAPKHAGSLCKPDHSCRYLDARNTVLQLAPAKAAVFDLPSANWRQHF